MSLESLFPTRLAHVLRLILGLCTSLIKTENVFKQATHPALPPSESQHVLWGRNFLNTSQIKWIRCRPDSSCQDLCATCGGRQSSIPPKFPPSWYSQNVWGPPGSLSESRVFPALWSPKPIKGRQEPKEC